MRHKFTLLRIEEIKHIDKNGNILWQEHNLPNTFHIEGEEFVLRAAFVGGQANTYIPENYYFGLDNRTTLTVDDTMATIVTEGSEPSGNGYFRQAVSSSSQFQITLAESGHTKAVSPIVTFVASGGNWGPVQNLFLTDQADNTGFLIASVALSTTLTVNDGEGVHMRMSLTLGQCDDLPQV